MFEVVEGPDGRAWTVAVVRSNQWQAWGWIRYLDRLMDRDGSGSAILIVFMMFQLPGIFPVAGRWMSYHLRRRQDVKLTVRAGRHDGGNALQDTHLDDLFESKDSAMKRASQVIRDIKHGSWP